MQVREKQVVQEQQVALVAVVLAVQAVQADKIPQMGPAVILVQPVVVLPVALVALVALERRLMIVPTLQQEQGNLVVRVILVLQVLRVLLAP